MDDFLVLHKGDIIKESLMVAAGRNSLRIHDVVSSENSGGSLEKCLEESLKKYLVEFFDEWLKQKNPKEVVWEFLKEFVVESPMFISKVIPGESF